MSRAFFSLVLKRGRWLVMLAGLAAFAVSFGALIVFATGWAAAVIPTISETVLNAILPRRNRECDLGVPQARRKSAANRGRQRG